MPRVKDAAANAVAKQIRADLILTEKSEDNSNGSKVVIFTHQCFLCSCSWVQKGQSHARLGLEQVMTHMKSKHGIDTVEQAGKARMANFKSLKSALRTGSCVSSTTGSSIPLLFVGANQSAWSAGGQCHQRFLDALVDLVAANVVSFRGIESPAFVKLVGILRPELRGRAITRAALTKALDARDAVACAHMTTVFQDAIGLSISFDGTDLHGYKVLAVMAHYTLRGSTEVQAFPIALVSPKDDLHFDASKAMNIINEALLKWGIKRIDGCVNDGARDARKSARGLFTKVEDDAGRFALLNIPCIPHYLNLVAEAGIKAINQLCNSGRNMPPGVKCNGLFGDESSAGAVDGLLKHFLGINRRSRVLLDQIIDANEELWPERESRGTIKKQRPVNLTTWDRTRWWSFLAVLRALGENIPFIDIYMKRFKDEHKRTAAANAPEPPLIGYSIAVSALKDQLKDLEKLLVAIREPALRLQASKKPTLPEFPHAISRIYITLLTKKEERHTSRTLAGVFAVAALDKFMAVEDSSGWGGSIKTIVDSLLAQGAQPLRKPGSLDARGRSKQAVLNWINTSFCYSAAVASALHPSPSRRRMGFYLLGVERFASEEAHAIALTDAASTMRAFMGMDGNDDMIGPGEPARKKRRVSKNDAGKRAASSSTIFGDSDIEDDDASSRPQVSSLRRNVDSFLADMRKMKENKLEAPEFLVYWNRSGENGLGDLALKLAAVLVSQADTERLFSTLSFAWPPSHSRLQIEHVEQLLRVRHFRSEAEEGDATSVNDQMMGDVETCETWRVLASIAEGHW